LFAGGCGAGMLNFTLESRSDKLWIPQGTTALQQQEFVEANFEAGPRFNNVIVQAKGGSDANLLLKTTLLDALTVHQRIVGLTLPVVENEDGDFVRTDADKASETLTFDSVCLKAGAGRCVLSSPLKAWNYDRFLLANDNDTLATLNNALDDPDVRTNLGGVRFESGDDGRQRLVFARALRFVFFLANNAEVRDGNLVDARAEAFEQAILNTTRPDLVSFDRVQVFPNLQRSQGE
jgi:hypothetical protein